VPTTQPTESPTEVPTLSPTESPTYVPTALPTESPTYYPTAEPTLSPTGKNSKMNIDEIEMKIPAMTSWRKIQN